MVWQLIMVALVQNFTIFSSSLRNLWQPQINKKHPSHDLRCLESKQLPQNTNLSPTERQGLKIKIGLQRVVLVALNEFIGKLILTIRGTVRKQVRCISIYWCKAKHSGHLATVSDYFLFNQFKYYYKLLYLKLNIYVSFGKYYWKFSVDVLSLLSCTAVLNHAYNFLHLTS